LAYAKRTGARVLVLEYRLAPEDKFPLALEDALAAYLYLTMPTADGGMGIPCHKLCFMGDSAGGGLSLATLLALRDANMPMPAGAALWSPWVDLLQNCPSIMGNAASDYLSDPEPFPDHPHFYSGDWALLKCPYVSPLYCENWKGLPPLLIQCGDGERLLDECVMVAERAAGDWKAAAAGGGGGGPIVTLEVYQDMPHVFQAFRLFKLSEVSYERSAAWLRAVMATEPEKRQAIKEGWWKVNDKGELVMVKERASKL